MHRSYWCEGSRRSRSSKAIKPSKKQGDPSNKWLGIALNKYVKNLLVARILCVTNFNLQVGSDAKHVLRDKLCVLCCGSGWFTSKGSKAINVL
jgi:hypothetical protein